MNMSRNHKRKAIGFLMAAMQHLQSGYPLLAREALEAALRLLELLIGAVPDYSCLQKPVVRDYQYFEDHQNLAAKLTTSRCIVYAINELHDRLGERNACRYIWIALCQLNTALYGKSSMDRAGSKSARADEAKALCA